MAYRVIMQEIVRRRPKWLIRFLLSLSPDIYDSKQSFNDAKKSIADIARTIDERTIDETQLKIRKSRLHIIEESERISILSAKAYPYVHFYIDHNYQDIDNESEL